MPHCVRAFIPGGTFFFTVALPERRRALLTENIDALRGAFIEVRRKHPFALDAVVVLPDHLHCVWTLPEGDGDFSIRWHGIRWRFSRAIPPGEHLSPRRQRKSERGIWQHRFWEHAIRDETDLARQIDYIHYNPVKHGLVPRAADWLHSSFGRFVAAVTDQTRLASPRPNLSFNRDRFGVRFAVQNSHTDRKENPERISP